MKPPVKSKGKRHSVFVQALKHGETLTSPRIEKLNLRGWLEIECKFCEGRLAYSPQEIGKTVTCPHCGEDISLFCQSLPSKTQPQAPSRNAPISTPLITAEELVHYKALLAKQRGIKTSIGGTLAMVSAFAVFALGLFVVCVAIYKIASYEKPEPEPKNYTHTPSKESYADQLQSSWANGFTWRAATYSEKTALCQRLAKESTIGNASIGNAGAGLVSSRKYRGDFSK